MLSSSLSDLIARLQKTSGIVQKQDIQLISWHLPHLDGSAGVLLGDDCAAIPEPEGYLLFAAEGMLPQLVETDPWFAGWSAVMVNVSDIYAMGGRPIAVVDALWGQSQRDSTPLLAGMQAAAQAYQVPIVGGHTNCHSPYNGLAVAIVGRAQRLLSSFAARPGDFLLLAIDLRGQLHPQYPFWNAATEADPALLRQTLAVLPSLAESGLCEAGKDISMGGIIGTALMLLETSGWGAVLNLEAIPRPEQVPLDKWLICFPSYGFLLSVAPENVEKVHHLFQQQGITCATIGQVEPTSQLRLSYGGETQCFWDWAQQPLMGFSHGNAGNPDSGIGVGL